MLLGILLAVFLARNLGAAEYGKYAFAIAFTSLLLFIADPGLSALSIREIARDTRKADKYMTHVSVTKLVLSLLMVGVIAIAINLMGYPSSTITIVYILGFTNVFGSFSVFFRSIFRAFEKMEYEALTRISERVLVVGAALGALALGYSLTTVVSVMLLAQAFGFLFTLLVCIRKFARPRLSFDFSFSKLLVKTALPLTITAIFSSIVFYTDMVMLSMMKGDEVVGWYGAAHRLISGMIFVPAVFTGAIFPVISRYFVSSRDNLVLAYGKSLKFLATLAIPLGIGTILIAGRLISFLYGTEFTNSVIVLQVLTGAVSLIFFITFLEHTLVSIDKQVVGMRIVGMTALLNVILNLSLIPSFSYTGAAAASVASQVFAFAWIFGYLQKHLSRINLLGLISKPLFAAVVMGAVVYGLDRVLADSTVNLFVIILSAVAIYGLLLYLLKAFDYEERQAIRGIFSRRP